MYTDITKNLLELPPVACIPPLPEKKDKPRLPNYIRDRLRFIDENVKHDVVFDPEKLEKHLRKGQSGYDSEGNYIAYK